LACARSANSRVRCGLAQDRSRGGRLELRRHRDRPGGVVAAIALGVRIGRRGPAPARL